MQKINVSLILFFFVAIVRSDSVMPAKQTNKSTITRQALQGKEAFVNVPMIFDQSLMGKELHQEMVEQARKFQKALEEQGKDIERSKKELSNKAAAMSPEAVRQEEKRIAQLERDLSIQIKEKEEDFQIMAAKKEQAWAQEFQQVVSDWAREQEFEKVWDEVSGKPLYVDNKLKHTDEIIACMNKKSSDKKLASVSAEKSKDSSVKKV